MNAETVKSLHDKAMSAVDDGDAARRSGLNERAIELYAAAYQWEREAARLIDAGRERSRGILFRSAAWLALRAEMPAESLEMVQEARAGHPPASIELELREVEDAALAKASRLTKKAS